MLLPKTAHEPGHSQSSRPRKPLKYQTEATAGSLSICYSSDNLVYEPWEASDTSILLKRLLVHGRLESLYRTGEPDTSSASRQQKGKPDAVEVSATALPKAKHFTSVIDKKYP